MTKTALYRHFDQDGALLYVGIAISAAERLKQHLGSAIWSDDIANVSLEYHPTRAAAERAEREAIKIDRPRFNKMHKAVASGVTVGAICDAIGRRALSAATGVGLTAISNACVANEFPPRWYIVVSSMCADAGIDCPPYLFGFLGVERPLEAEAV